MVCELCEARAANEGWIREGADNALTVRRDGARGGRSFLERLRPRRDAPVPEVGEIGAPTRRGRVQRIQAVRSEEERLVADLDGVDADAEPAPAPAPERERDGRPITTERPAVSARHDPAREPRHVHAVPTNADLKMGRALDVFNASPHPRRVAGVSRSLGTPFISVLLSETEGAIVTIIVAWELCWYRYEVDLADEASGVRVLAQGAELSELSEAERVPNAAADERGLLVLAE
ncbi:MAG: hypothetical protein QOG15_94 [Solirubrobacteraceae bacterium]|jgi:hypothetical protein|nr:hypothetical protein [Solirubrobacteraceae bacterium]